MPVQPFKVLAFATFPVYALPSVCSGDIFSDIADIALAPITAPFEATKAIIEGDDPTKVVTDPIQSGGRVINQVVQDVERVHDVISQSSRDLISNNLGDDWARGFDILTSSQRISFEMQMTGGRFLGDCLQSGQCDVRKVAALPVAAAMRDAYKMYIDYSSPLDPQLQQYLSVVVDWRVVSQARITVGSTPDFTIPGFLNAAYEASGSGHAVTLGNLMVFSRQPDLSTCDDFIWLLHEMRHIQQYMGYSNNVLESIDGFAVDYIDNYGGMEDDAEATAQQQILQLESYYGFQCNLR